MKLNFFSILFLIFTVQVQAKHVGVNSVEYVYSCGYYSSSHSSLRVNYSNPNVPQAARVKLISGWGGYKALGGGAKEFFSWRNRTERQMIGVESSSWAVEFSEQLHSRSSADFKDTLQFVFEINLPNGHTYYDKGSETTWGYYQSTLPFVSSSSQCLKPGELPGAKSRRQVVTVDKE